MCSVKSTENCTAIRMGNFHCSKSLFPNVNKIIVQFLQLDYVVNFWDAVLSAKCYLASCLLFEILSKLFTCKKIFYADDLNSRVTKIIANKQAGSEFHIKDKPIDVQWSVYLWINLWLDSRLICIKIGKNWWTGANQMLVTKNIVYSSNSWPNLCIWLNERL